MSDNPENLFDLPSEIDSLSNEELIDRLRYTSQVVCSDANLALLKCVNEFGQSWCEPLSIKLAACFSSTLSKRFRTCLKTGPQPKSNSPYDFTEAELEHINHCADQCDKEMSIVFSSVNEDKLSSTHQLKKLMEVTRQSDIAQPGPHDTQAKIAALEGAMSLCNQFSETATAICEAKGEDHWSCRVASININECLQAAVCANPIKSCLRKSFSLNNAKAFRDCLMKDESTVACITNLTEFTSHAVPALYETSQQLELMDYGQFVHSFADPNANATEGNWTAHFDGLACTPKEYAERYIGLTEKECAMEMRDMRKCMYERDSTDYCLQEATKLGACSALHMCTRYLKKCIDRGIQFALCSDMDPEVAACIGRNAEPAVKAEIRKRTE